MMARVLFPLAAMAACGAPAPTSRSGNLTPGQPRPRTQTALKTRAHPFAIYVARMHRPIHELWALGFLSDLDKKATVVKPSGTWIFDAAAVETLVSAAPYEETPEAIRSADGRVHLRWGLYRDQRQCSTFNVEPLSPRW